MHSASVKPTVSMWKWLLGRCAVLLVICFLLFQLFFLYALYSRHALFEESVRDVSELTTSNLKTMLRTRTSRDPLRRSFGEESASEQPVTIILKDADFESPPANRIEEVGDVSFNAFPFRWLHNGDDKSQIPLESQLILRNSFGNRSLLPATDFPDLKYRSPEEVREQFPQMFRELPSHFDARYKNPCWQSVHGDKSAVHCLPYVYILGQPKSGTSDLYERLRAHHLVIPPKRKEVRFFTRGEFTDRSLPHEDVTDDTVFNAGYRKERLMGKSTSLLTFTSYFDEMANFIRADMDGAPMSSVSVRRTKRRQDKVFDDDPRAAITVDGGPHTLWWPTQSPDGTWLPNDIPIPQLLRELQPHAKFVVTVSDPVQRFYSDFHFLNDDRRPVDNNAHGNNLADKSAKKLHSRVLSQVASFHRCVDHYMKEFLSAGTMQERARPIVPLNLSNPLYEMHSNLWFRASQMCAHDRHAFGLAGYGRLAIGLYSLFLEKWLEHFPLSQILVLRLEDYDNDPQGQLIRLFSFLQLEPPRDWSLALKDVHFNAHKGFREPMMKETESILREFYRPYNAILASFLQDPAFAFIEESSNKRVHSWPETRESSRSEDSHSEPATELEAVRNEVPPLKVTRSKKRLALRGRASAVAEGLSDTPPAAEVHLRPQQVSIDGLPEAMDFQLTDPKYIELLSVNFNESSTEIVGNHLCEAVFRMNTAMLRYLLFDIGIPANATSKHNRNAWHCLASVYTFGDAHGRSQVFSELRGKESFLANLFVPPLPTHESSVLSREVLESLSFHVDRTAKWLIRFNVSVDALDAASHTPLHMTSLGGLRNLTVLLLALGAQPNTLNDQLRTPLHFAAALGHAEIGQALIEAGASLDNRDTFGVTPREIISQPGAIAAEDALKYFNIAQREAKQIERLLKPEAISIDPSAISQSQSSRRFQGWVGSGNWNSTRMRGYEEDLSCPSVDQYFADEVNATLIYDYLARNAPIMIRGLLHRWPINELFAKEALQARHGNMSVLVSDIPYANKFGGQTAITMTLNEYIEGLTSQHLPGEAHPWYVFKGHPVGTASEAADSLVPYKRLPTPWALHSAFLAASKPVGREREEILTDSEPTVRTAKEREVFINAQWAFGGPATGAPVHFHNTAWSALFFGAKKWYIYPPHDMIMSNKQILAYVETDELEMQTKNARAVTCVQTAGDVVIIPESWGHGVLNLQDSIAMASEFRSSVWRLKPPITVVAHSPAYTPTTRELHPPPVIPRSG